DREQRLALAFGDVAVEEDELLESRVLRDRRRVEADVADAGRYSLLDLDGLPELVVQERGVDLEERAAHRDVDLQHDEQRRREASPRNGSALVTRVPARGTRELVLRQTEEFSDAALLASKGAHPLLPVESVRALRHRLPLEQSPPRLRGHEPRICPCEA